MASPFSIFRRNQKVLLAIVGVAAMVAFVFLDPLMRYMGRSGAPENPVIVETRYGNITQAQMYAMRQARELVATFLRRAAEVTVDGQVKQGTVDPRQQMQWAEQWYNIWHNDLMTRSKPGPEEAAVETMLLARKAEELGMVVSDASINEVIKQITSNSLSPNTLHQIIEQLQPGRRVSEARLFDAMRTEMLASRYMRMFQQSLQDITPAQRFEYFWRLNQRATAEVLPLAVADFVKEVPEPSDEDVKTFFEKYKNVYPDPNSPEPGFKQPRKAAFEYFKADLATFREKYKPEVTEAEIAEYYEKNKAQFRALDLPEDETKPAEGESTDAKDGAKTDEAKPADDAKPADESKAGEDAKPSDEAKPEAPKADEPKAEESKPTEPKAGEEPTAPKISRATGKAASPFRLTSSAVNDGDEAAAAPEAGAAKDDAQGAAKDAAGQPEGDKPAAPAETPAAETPAAEQPADEKPAADAAKEEPAADAAAEKPSEAAAPEIKYEPLEKVKDKIIDTLASQKAYKQIDDIFSELQATMRRYADSQAEYEAAKQNDPKTKPPAPFPLAELAKTHGVEAKVMPLVSALEASKEDIGASWRRVPDPRSRTMRFETFGDFAFADTMPTYDPRAVPDNDGNVFLFWKTEQEASYVPKLEQIRDQVVRAWKLIKARDLARKRADELAAQARGVGKPLKDVFADSEMGKRVIETDPFSWLTHGDVPSNMGMGQNPPRISEVEGVDGVGVNFMKTVFGLTPGGIGVANNYPESYYFVVRLVDFTQPIEELRSEFANQPPGLYMSAAVPEQREIMYAWLAELNKDAKVQWVRQADSGSRGRPSESAPSPDDFDL